MIFVGVQGAGKSTFFRERFFDTHVRISRDLLRTPNRERVFLEACLQTSQPFVLDKVNATALERFPYVEAARGARYRLVAYWFDVPVRDAISRNDRRSAKARIPVQAILGTYKRLQPPKPEEGFDDVFRVQVSAGDFEVSRP